MNRLEMVIFLKSGTDSDPNVPRSFDIWHISGQEIPFALLEQFRDFNQDETETLFHDFEAGRAYRVELSYECYEDHYEPFVMHSEWVKSQDSRV